MQIIIYASRALNSFTFLPLASFPRTGTDKVIVLGLA